MKRIIIFLGMMSLLFLIAYLIGSFAQATFNIKKWNDEFRVPFATIAGIVSLIISQAFISRDIMYR